MLVLLFAMGEIDVDVDIIDCKGQEVGLLLQAVDIYCTCGKGDILIIFTAKGEKEA